MKKLNHLSSKLIGKHFCPNSNANAFSQNQNLKLNEQNLFHDGDFGNIIANEDGIANISLKLNKSIKMFVGRMVVILKNKDLCNENNEFDEKNDVIKYGILGVYKP